MLLHIKKHSGSIRFVLLVVLCSFAISQFFVRHSYATNDPSAPHFSVVSVSENGSELEKLWADDLRNPFGDDYDFGAYYYHSYLSQNKIRIGVEVNGLAGNTEYTIFDNTRITSADNGSIVYGEITPSISFEEYSNTKGEYSYYLSLHKSDYSEWYDSEILVFRPDDIGGYNLKLLSAKQNDADLILDKNEFLVNDYDAPIELSLELTNLEIGWNYNVSGDFDTISFVADSEAKTVPLSIMPSVFGEHNSVYIWASGSYYRVGKTNQSSYSSLSINYKITDPSFTPLGEIYVDSVSQSGQDITPDCNSTYNCIFTLNDIEDVEITVHADGAMDEYVYPIAFTLSYSWSLRSRTGFSGGELKNGTTITLSPGSESGRGPLDEDQTLTTIYQKSGTSTSSLGQLRYRWPDGQNATLRFIIDENIPRLDSIDIEYANYPNVHFGGVDTEQTIFKVIVSPLYHSENNPLAIKISGQFFNESESYPIGIRITDNTHKDESGNFPVVYEANFAATGGQLNDGHLIVLDDFAMEFSSNDAIFEDNGQYSFYVTVNSQTKSIGRDYVYGPIYVNLLQNNWRQNATAGGAGALGARFTAESILTNREMVSGTNQMLLRYRAVALDPVKSYEYALYYGENKQTRIKDIDSDTSGYEKIANGTVLGARLNAGAFALPISNPNNYTRPTYILRLMVDGKVVNEITESLALWDGAGLLSTSLYTSKLLYLQTHNFQYYVPKESKVTVAANATSFIDDKKYKVTVILQGYSAGTGYYAVDLSDLRAEKTFTGRQLNKDGFGVSLAYDERFKDLSYIWVRIEIEDEEGETYAGSSFALRYINIEDIFHSIENYTVNAVGGLISGVSKRTAASTFSEKFEVENNGSMKVFDRNGETEQTEKVGTGMIARVVDEFEQPVMDMDVVVTGDVTGDGEINILDVVKERRHLAGLEALEGVYEIAGKITSDRITILDLTRIRQDVAGIKEVNE